MNLFDVSLQAEDTRKVLTAIHAVLLVTLRIVFQVISINLTLEIYSVLVLSDVRELLGFYNHHLRGSNDMLELNLFGGKPLFLELI